MGQVAFPLLLFGDRILEFLEAEGKGILATLAPRRRLSRLKVVGVNKGDHPAFVSRDDGQDSLLAFRRGVFGDLGLFR